jgi:hypothetical protein
MNGSRSMDKTGLQYLEMVLLTTTRRLNTNNHREGNTSIYQTGTIKKQKLIPPKGHHFQFCPQNS